jgi:hypothetical protein
VQEASLFSISVVKRAATTVATIGREGDQANGGEVVKRLLQLCFLTCQ